MKNRYQLLSYAVATGLACFLVWSIPLAKTSTFVVSTSPVYSAKLRLASESPTSQLLMIDTQGQPINRVHVVLSSVSPQPVPLPGCTISEILVVRCIFTQTTQQQLIPIVRFSNLSKPVQVLAGSSIESNGQERLRQFPLLDPTQ